MARERRIGFFVYNGLTTLDLTGPMDAFKAALNADGSHAYELVTIGTTEQPVTAENGLRILPSSTLRRVRSLDTIFIPGGQGLREPAPSNAISKWLLQHHPTVRRVVAICTGIYGVAPSGLLDGKRVTTHWRFAQDVQLRFPRLKVDASPIFLRDGKCYTSAGITSGIDLSLSLIEEDLGRAAALLVARELVVFLKRPGDQEQFSEPLQFQTQATDKTGDLAAWIETNLGRHLSVPVLAKRACLSDRHFARHFKNSFGLTPAKYVERARLERARKHLCETEHSVEKIGRAVGFASDDAFGRAFQRRFKVSPTNYRNTFGPEGRSATQ